MRRASLLVVVAGCLYPPGSLAIAQPGADAADIAQGRWYAGQLAAAESDLEALLKQNERDDLARYALGVTRLFRAAERAAQSLNHYGLRPNESLGVLNFVGVPVPAMAASQPARQTEPIRYEDVRRILETFISDIESADRTLAAIQDENVKLRLKIGMVRIDFNGDGTATPEETLWVIYSRLNRQVMDVDQATAESFIIMLDRGDVEWLLGYCNVLCGLAEFALAMDFRELFERTAHLFFANPQTPYPFLQHRGNGENWYEFSSIVDLIAYIHLINFKADPQRLASVRDRFEKMTMHSRRMWRFVLAETDDDHEWIPSPRQHAGVLGVEFTQEMVDGWIAFLDELDEILAGRKRVPFWRAGEPRGVNLRRAFTESTNFDLVMWIQGTGAAAFLEAGPQTDSATWERFTRIFQGDFIGFAIWVN